MQVYTTKKRSAITQSIFCITFLVTACFLLHIQCKGSESPSRERASRSFKLTEHPEVLATDGVQFDDVRGELTLNDDTRQGFLMGEINELVFDVFLPPGGTLKYAHGIGPHTTSYVDELTLNITAEGDEDEVLIGFSIIRADDENQVNEWRYNAIPIPEGLTGNRRLIFSFSGFVERAPPDAFFLAHPTQLMVAANLPGIFGFL